MIMQKCPTCLAARCAVALNNVGCLLLERSCTEQAYQTFKEALQLVQIQVVAERERPLQSLPVEDVQQQITYMHEMVHQAQLRLIVPKTTHFVTPYKSLVYSDPSPDVHLVLPLMLQNSHYSIRIEMSGADDARQIPDDILTTIVLLNFVNAGRTMAAIKDRMSGSNSKQVNSKQVDGPGRQCGANLGRSVKILELANAFVEQSDDGSESSLFLVLVALDTTVQVHAEAGRTAEAAALGNRLEALKFYVETTLGFLFDRTPAAGAA